MKHILSRFPAIVAVLLVTDLFSSALPVTAQTRPPKPSVAPTDGKPARYGTPVPKIGTAVLTFRLRHDRRLDGSHIRVTSFGRAVGLYGSVPNYHQRRIARQLAQSMMGVTYVADHLRVIAQPPSAEILVGQIKAALHQDPITKNAPIAVIARRDIVTLSGTVATLRVKQDAIRLAHKTPRVSVVQDHLIVSPGAAGEALASSVRAALLRDQANPVRSLKVLVNGSYIYLRGVVFSQAAKRQAGDTAAAVPGVTGLSNTLTILPARLR